MKEQPNIFGGKAVKMDARPRFRFLTAEQLEERIALSAAPFVSADVPFASAADMFEAGTAFIEVPAPAAVSSIGEYYVGTFYDVNKYRDGTDSQLCWAAATANILAYTNWGYSTAVSGETPDEWLFSTEYEIYDYFIDNFTNKGGHLYYAFPWYTSGEYTIQGSSGWSQVTGDGGYLYPGISIPDVRPYLHYETCQGTLISEMVPYLEKGYGVVMALGWYNTASPTRRSGGHSVSVWGYTYDESLDPADPSYYTGIIVTNSDDNYTGTKTLSVEYSEEYGMYRVTDYSGGRGWIEDFTCIKPVETLSGVAAHGYTGVYDGAGHTVTVNGIPDSGDDEYTVIYNYDGTFALTSPEYTDPGTYTVVVVTVKNEFDAIWSAPVTITITEDAPQTLDCPEITSLASGGGNRHSLTWTDVDDATGYEAAWSSDGGETWSTQTTLETKLLVTDLTYGSEIRYRVRALGNGTDTKTSDWSAEKSLTVNPSDIDGDGFIGPGDYALISSVWFSSDEGENWDPRCDVDCDGFIGPGDFTFLSANWLKDSDDDDFAYPPTQNP